MAPVSLRVVCNAPYAVSLDTGRDLHPGAIAKVIDSERHQQLIADGLLAICVEPAKKSSNSQKEENPDA